MNLKPYAKAILAALIAGVGGIALGYTDDALSKGELWGSISLGLVAGGGVFGVPNRDPRAEHQDESVQPAEHRSLFDE
jgi:hypothetical protein